MILRVIAGLVVAMIYAALAGTFTYLCWLLTNDPAHPGPPIPDNNAWGRIAVFAVTVTTAILGAGVALAVTLTRSRKLYSALFGGAVGLVLFLMYLADALKRLPPPWRSQNEVWGAVAICFVLFPVGLTITALAAAAIASRLKG
jgi:hypothetical protein